MGCIVGGDRRRACVFEHGFDGWRSVILVNVTGVLPFQMTLSPFCTFLLLFCGIILADICSSSWFNIRMLFFAYYWI